MKVEYLVPILAGASPALKLVFTVWLVLTLIVGGWVLKIYITQNIKKFNVEQQKPYIEIKREISDYSVFLQDIISQHKKSIDDIASKMNRAGMYSSGPHIKTQYELVKENQSKASNQWEVIKRKVEDVLMNCGKTQIEDKNVKKEYDVLQQNKDATINKIINATDEYFANRSGTFKKQTVEAIKKEVFK